MKTQKAAMGVLVAGVMALMVPFALLFAISPTSVFANANVCPQGVNWSTHQAPPLEEKEGVTEYCVKAGSVDNGNDVSFDLNKCEAYFERGSFEYVSGIVGADGACELSHWSYRLPPPPPPIELFNNCNRWVVKQGDVELDKGQWTLPFELESAESDSWRGTIHEPERCLQIPEDPILRIAGTCSDEGVGQIVGSLNLGGLGVALLIEGQGSQHVIDENGEFGPIPARAGDYTWTIFGLGDNGRYVISNGEFTVDVCYQTCDETFREAQEPTYSDWTEWDWDGDRGLFVQTRIKSTVVLAIDARDKETVCARGVIEEKEERTRGPDEALVGVSLICHVPAGDGVVYQLTFSVTVEPAGGATVFFNGNEYTESTGGYIGFGRYDWSAEAAESFKIVGDDEGTVKLKRDDCNPEEPPEHPPTGGEMDAGLAVVTGLMGFALAGIGGSILFMKRRASR